MDRKLNPHPANCKLCDTAFALPENGDEDDCNLPRLLPCGHVYCTTCLLAVGRDNVISCPECQTESLLPEGGVYELQEESTIIGLLHTTKTNKNRSLRNQRSEQRTSNQISPPTDENCNTKDAQQAADMENMMNKALAQAAENLAQLENIHNTLAADLAEQAQSHKVCMETQAKQAVVKARHAVQKWKDALLHQLTKSGTRFSLSQEKLSRVEERIKSLEVAMRKARVICRVPDLKQYCSLETLLETLQAPVDKESFHVPGNTVDSELSCIFQSEILDHNDSLLLRMEVTTSPVGFSDLPPSSHQLATNVQPSDRKCPATQNPEVEISVSEGPSAQDSTPGGPETPNSGSFSESVASSEPESPDVIIEEYFVGDRAAPPTEPELAHQQWKPERGEKNKRIKKTNVTMWVTVTHIVNPNDFYVCYIAEKKENEALSKKINQHCWREDCCFALDDVLETGSMIFAKWPAGLWCRATILELQQHGCAEDVKYCSVNQLANIKVFFLDNGLTRSFSIMSCSREDGSESVLTVVNEHLRKVDRTLNVDLYNVAPPAVRCSLKGLLPYNPSKGWCKEAIIEFNNLVGSMTLEMKPLGQDADCLLVDLRKVLRDGISISVAEFLVFTEVARFHSPGAIHQSPRLYAPPVYPKLHTEVSAVVSHINNPADFYIQLVGNSEYMLLSARIQDCYSRRRGSTLHLHCPAIDQACVVRFEDSWYRAQVIGFSGDKRVEVRCVDSGSEITVGVNNLRILWQDFYAFPITAIHCSLSEVTPVGGGSWGEECTKRFISLAHQKLVTVVATGPISKTEPLQIRLFQSSLYGAVANIAELLVQEGLACFREELTFKDFPASADEFVIWDPPVELDSAADLAGETRPNEKSEQQQEEEPEFEPQLKLPTCLKDLKVHVSHVNSPSSFFVQLTESSSQLKRLSELLKRECEPAEPQDTEWKVGVYVAALSGAVWERGQVCGDVTSSGVAQEVKVMRCDHGNCVKLDVCKLRPLPQHLQGTFALECSLTGIRPAGGQSSWTATACDFIIDCLGGALAYLTVQEVTEQRPVPVTLRFANKMGRMVSAADFLVSHGLALRDRKAREPEEEQADVQPHTSKAGSATEDTQLLPPHTPHKDPPKPRPRRFISAEMVETQWYLPPELPRLGTLQVNVTAVGEDGLIYVTTQDAEGQLEQLRERIRQRMKTLPQPKPYTWKLVHGCAVSGPDMVWYRGHLLEVLGEYVKVQYVDSGMVESIPVVHVYPTLLCEDVPQLCLPCQLHGLNSLGGRWQRDALALMQDIMLKRSVKIELKELPSDPRGPVGVDVFLNGVSLSTIMCQHGHATIDQTVASLTDRPLMSPACPDQWDIDTEGLELQEPTSGSFVLPNPPRNGEHFRVRVKHLVTPNELYLWPLEGAATVVDGETLNEALTRINANISSLPPLESLSPGCPCLAEYGDQKYYRAELISVIGTEPIQLLVHHVDFGSDDTLPPTKIRQMPPELLRFPVEALKVKVFGLRPPSAGSQECMLPYSPEWSLTATMEMVDLLHGSITASVVSCEPELKVLLYDEDGELLYRPLVDSGLADLE